MKALVFPLCLANMSPLCTTLQFAMVFNQLFYFYCELEPFKIESVTVYNNVVSVIAKFILNPTLYNNSLELCYD